MIYGEVLELADRHDLGSCAERRGGSSPPFPTNLRQATNFQLLLGETFIALSDGASEAKG